MGLLAVLVGVPCRCVMNIFPMLPILTLLLCNCRSVASPQSNSQTSSFRPSVRDELLLVKDGIADTVPRKVTTMGLVQLGGMVHTEKWMGRK